MSRRTTEDVLDCVVVGAGAAGLAAAATLREAGRTFVVLEARDRIGGRAHTVRLSGGQAAERGAEYLHGARVATWEYVARFGLATHLASGPTRIGVPEYRDGEWWPEGTSNADGALRGLGAALSIPDAPEVSLREALVRAGFSGDRLRAAEGRMEVLSPIDPTVVSARSAAAAWRLVAPETANFVLVGGYAELWGALSRPFADRIRLASPVTGLDWSGAGVASARRRADVRGTDGRRHPAGRCPPGWRDRLSTRPPGPEEGGHRRPAERGHRQADRRVPPAVLGSADRHGPELSRP